MRLERRIGRLPAEVMEHLKDALGVYRLGVYRKGGGVFFVSCGRTHAGWAALLRYPEGRISGEPVDAAGPRRDLAESRPVFYGKPRSPNGFGL